MADTNREIRTLYEIAADHREDFAGKIKRILRLCLDRFNLDIGILAEVRGDEYTALYCVAPETLPLKDGNRFSLKDTYCSLTIRAAGPLWFEHAASDQEISVHPAYRSLQLESYIGIPVRLDGKIFGTLNFSSPDRRPRLFRKEDVDFLRLVSAWMAAEIFRSRGKEELTRAAGKSKSLPGLIPLCACCKQIRSGKDVWAPLETYFATKVDAEFFHAICPACVRTHYPDLVDDASGD